MAHKITLIPGDVTGPEVSAAVRKIIDTAGVAVEWDEQFLAEGKIPTTLVESVHKNGVALMGFQRAYRERNEPPPIVRLRKTFGMFANIRPVRSMAGFPTRHGDVDLVVVREVTEDIYAHLEHESIPGVYESLKVTTKAACERIARYAFQYARDTGRKKVTIVHKANIMKRSDGMFLKTSREVATEFPDIQSEDVIVDALCMKLVISPSKFDVLVAGNLYGDIVADLCAGLAGGSSNCTSINVGPDVRIFASPHGDPPGHQEPNMGNPLTLLMPAIEMLKQIGEKPAADRIAAAVQHTLTGGTRPMAIGGRATTAMFTAAVCEAL